MNKLKSYIVACITNQKSAWRVLYESIEQARLRSSGLRVIVCPNLIRKESSFEITQDFLSKLQHAAESSCREHGINLQIDTIDYGHNDVSSVPGLIDEGDTELLIMTDPPVKNKLFDLFIDKTKKLIRACHCSVMIIR